MARWVLAGGVAAVAAIAGCGAEPTQEPVSTTNVAIAVTPLSLSGPSEVCYDLEVKNGLGEVVWRRGNPAVDAPSDPNALCSSRYGNGAGGAIAFVGPCDAGAPNHTVTLWVDGLLQGAAALTDWQDPCPTGCAVPAVCVENSDTPVSFELVVMRAAQQGFFDVAVNFEDIFCSAKVDCTRDAEGNEPITLLFDANGQRSQTAVAAVACTRGPGAAGGGTVLHMNGVHVICEGSAPTPDLLQVPRTCTAGGDLYGFTMVYDTNLSNMVSYPTRWTPWNSAELLPTDGYAFGAVYARLDDTHLVGVVGNDVIGGFERLALWTDQGGGSWTLTSTSIGEHWGLGSDALQRFWCIGDADNGARCFGDIGFGAGVPLLYWDIFGGQVEEPATTAGLPGSSCARPVIAGQGFGVWLGMRCGDAGPHAATAHVAAITPAATWETLPLPSGTPTRLAPATVSADAVAGLADGGLAGSVTFDGATTPLSRLVHWSLPGATWQVDEIVTDPAEDGVSYTLRAQLGQGFLAVQRDGSPVDAFFRWDAINAVWQSWSAFTLAGSSPATLEIEGFFPSVGAQGAVYGRFTAAGGSAPVPFVAWLPPATPPTAVELTPLPLPLGVDDQMTFFPVADASSASEARLAVVFNDGVGGPDRQLVWTVGYDSAHPWAELGHSTYAVVDLMGAWTRRNSWGEEVVAQNYGSCAGVFGVDEEGFGRWTAATWAYPPSTAGEALWPSTSSGPSVPGSGSGAGADVTYALDPTVEGNAYSPPLAGAPVWQYAIYRGEEALPCGGVPCNKVYWNTAVGFDPAAPGCRLVMEFTAAADPGLPNDATPPTATAYPYVTVDVPLTSASADGPIAMICRQHPLNGADGAVRTVYTAADTPRAFCHRFDGTTASAVPGCTYTP